MATCALKLALNFLLLFFIILVNLIVFIQLNQWSNFRGVLYTTLNLNPERIISAFNTYMKLSQLSVRRKDFLVNLEEKINDSDFRKDIFGLIHPSITCNIDEAYTIVRDSIVMLLME